MSEPKPVKNCFECTGGEEMKHCEFYAQMDPGQRCVYRTVADSDLKKYRDGSKVITLGTMLKQHIKKHPELKIKGSIQPVYILGSEKSVRAYENAAQLINQPTRSFLSIDKLVGEAMGAHAVIIDSPLEDRSPEGQILSAAPIDGVYAAIMLQASGYKGKIYIFGKTNSQPLIDKLTFYPEGPMPELIDECLRIIQQT